MEIVMEKLLPDSCRLHEERLSSLEESIAVITGNIEELLERGNDFEIPVINGKTEYRKASELIGEMYLAIK